MSITESLKKAFSRLRELLLPRPEAARTQDDENVQARAKRCHFCQAPAHRGQAGVSRNLADVFCSALYLIVMISCMVVNSKLKPIFPYAGLRSPQNKKNNLCLQPQVKSNSAAFKHKCAQPPLYSIYHTLDNIFF